MMNMVILAVDQIYDEVELYFYVPNVCIRVHLGLSGTLPVIVHITRSIILLVKFTLALLLLLCFYEILLIMSIVHLPLCP